MKNVELLYPRSLEEALALLQQHGDDAKVIAGGTALVIMMTNGLVAPGVLISLQHLDDLRTFHREDGGLRFGALKTIRFGETSTDVRATNPALAEVFGTVASVRIRSVATIGGNLTEADYASDPPGFLVAMGARIKAASVAGVREIAVADLTVDFYTTSLEHGELLTEIFVPHLLPTSAATYLKYSSRSSEDRPCVGVSAIVGLGEDGCCRDLRVVVSAVSEVPFTLRATEQGAIGTTLDARTIADIAHTYADEVDTLSDMRGSAWYRTRLVDVLVRRAIEKSRDKCPGACAPGFRVTEETRRGADETADRPGSQR